MPTKFKITFLFFLLLTGCGHLFYQPDHWKYNDPADFNIAYDDHFRVMSDGTKIHAWYLKRKDPTVNSQGLVLFFHGNGMNLTNHLPNLSWLTEKGFDIVLWDYRGYGRSEGEADHELVYRDSLEILNWAHQLKHEGHHPRLILYGQSLGGMILGRAIADDPQASDADWLVFDSTFMSYQDLAFDKLSSFWMTWPFSALAYILLSDTWAVEKVERFPQIKTLFIHSHADKVVPFTFGEQYFKHWQTPIKCFWTLPEGEHIETFHSHLAYLRDPFVTLITSSKQFSCLTPQT